MSDNNSKLFEKDLKTNKSRFRDLVEKRRSNFLEQEEYEEFVEKKVDSQSFLGVDGRPKILRNVISQRVAEFKKGNLNIDDKNDSSTHDAEDKISSMETISKAKSAEKQGEATPTYAEQRIKSFNNRNESQKIFSAARENDINNRKKMYESNNGFQNNIVEEIGGHQVPVHFLRESKTIDPKTKEVINVKFKDTIDGRDDFIRWLKIKNIYDLYKHNLKNIETEPKPKKEVKPSELVSNKESKNETNLKTSKQESTAIKKSPKSIQNPLVDSKSQFKNEELEELRKEIHELRTQILENTQNNIRFSDDDIEDDLFSLEDEEFSESSGNKLLKKIDVQIPDTVYEDINISPIFKIKNDMKEMGDNKFIFSTMAFVIKAISLSLNKYRIFNSKHDANYGTKIYDEQNIGLVIEYENKPLIPIIQSAENLSIKNIAKNISKFTAEIRSGEFKNDIPPTITVVNFGSVSSIASPKIQPNNSAAISLGKVIRKQIKSNEKLLNAATLKISLTYDQRICDQIKAKMFLKLVKNFLEKPQLLTLS